MERWYIFKRILIIICVLEFISFFTLFIRRLNCLDGARTNSMGDRFTCRSKSRMSTFARLFILFLDMIFIVLYLVGVLRERYRWLIPWVIGHLLSLIYVIGKVSVTLGGSYLRGFQAFLQIFVELVIWFTTFLALREVKEYNLTRELDEIGNYTQRESIE